MQLGDVRAAVPIEHLLYVSRMLGHATPAFTLKVYGHLMPGTRDGNRIEAALRGNGVATNGGKRGEVSRDAARLTPREV